jgi:hypothetical protein
MSVNNKNIIFVNKRILYIEELENSARRNTHLNGLGLISGGGGKDSTRNGPIKLCTFCTVATSKKRDLVFPSKYMYSL